MLMRIYPFIIIVLAATVVTGCEITPTVVTNPSETPISPPKQGEPGGPPIEGKITGVPDRTLVTIFGRKADGQELHKGERYGNGSWASGVTGDPSLDYVVTAEAKGYISTPTSYTIRVEGAKAFIVEDGHKTTKEALNLDFQFNPVAIDDPSQ